LPIVFRYRDSCLGEYIGVALLEVVALQRQSLLSVDITCSDVTDGGLTRKASDLITVTESQIMVLIHLALEVKCRRSCT
jgi:hypothetical protein